MADLKRILSNLTNSDPAVRLRVAEALLDVKDNQKSEIIESLRVLAKDADPNVRVVAIRALGEKQIREGLPEVITGLRDYENVDIRFTSAQSLGQIGDETAVSVLVDALADEDPRVKRYAIESLGSLGHIASSAVPDLEKAYKDASFDIKERIIRSLGICGGKKATAVLSTWLTVQDSAVIREVIMGLGYTGEERALNTLLEFVTNNPLASEKLVKKALGNALKLLLDQARTNFEGIKNRVETALKTL